MDTCSFNQFYSIGAVDYVSMYQLSRERERDATNPEAWVAVSVGRAAMETPAKSKRNKRRVSGKTEDANQDKGSFRKAESPGLLRVLMFLVY
jgi:hypothetical protein